MTDAFTLTVPADGRYRELGALAAAKYGELAGGSPADVQALAAAVMDAVDALAPPTDATAQIELAFTIHGGQVEITAHCSGRSSVVRRPLAAHHR